MAAVSPDERLLAVADLDGTITLCEQATGQVIRRVKAHSGIVSGLAFSPGGLTLASAGHADKILVFWDVSTLQELHRQRTPDYAQGLEFSPRGDLLATAHWEGVRLWTARTLAEIDANDAAEADRERLREELRIHRPRAVPVPGVSPALAAEPLDAYCGSYRSDPEPLLVVTRRENRLVVAAPGNRRLTVFPESAGHFVDPSSGARFGFEAGASGLFERLTVSQDGRSFQVHRLPPSGIEPPMLRD